MKKHLLKMNLQYFGREKNAVAVEYYIQPITADNKDAPVEDDYVELAELITTVSDNSNETSDDSADYAGDGTEETDVISHKVGRGFTGQFNPENPAQALIRDMVGTSGDARKVWLKILLPQENKKYENKATVTEPVAQVGDAQAWGEFSCNISYDRAVSLVDVVPNQQTPLA